MDSNKDSFIETCQLLSERLVHILVQARTGQTCSARCSPSYNEDDCFGLLMEELEEVAEFLDKNVQNYPPSTENLTIDFLMRIDDCYLPMESWCISMNDVDNLDQNVEPVPFDPKKLPIDVSTLLKGSIAAARATPMFRYFVKNPEYAKHIVFYRVYEGPPEIELGGSQKRYNVGSVLTPLGTLSLDVFYRVEFETCKGSCCSRKILKDRNSRARRMAERRSKSDVGTFLPFSPNGDFVATRAESEVACSNKKKQICSRDEGKRNIPQSKISFYLEKPISSGGSCSSSLTDILSLDGSVYLASKKRNLDPENSVPFFALLAASSTDKKASNGSTGPEADDPEELLEEVTDSTMCESLTSTLVSPRSDNEMESDSKASYYLLVGNDGNGDKPEVDDVSDSFIKVPSALLPTGDPSNVGDFIMFLRRCEVQEFKFNFENFDALPEQLSQFEAWQDDFDSFLADITEKTES